MKNCYLFLFFFFAHFSFSQNPTFPDVTCETSWEDATYGVCIGKNNNLIPYDFDNDGTVELIAKASVSGFGNGNDAYWYIVKYFPATNQYQKVYVSQNYNNKIGKIYIADIDNSGEDKLLIGLYKSLLVVNMNTFETEAVINLSGIFSIKGIQQIKFADADNDGNNEIIVGAEDEFTLIDPITLSVENTFNIEGGDFDIGNVDSDPELEIVFTHGRTIRIENGSIIDEYDFRPNENSEEGYIKLSDTDNDGMMEAVVMNDWYLIELFDVESESLKFDIDTDTNNSAFMMEDINDDGIEEIFYGEQQGGEIFCHDAQTGDELWSYYNTYSGVTGFAIADFDGDNDKELAWGPSCGEYSYLYFSNLADQSLEWKNNPTEGRFNAVEIADIDGDNSDEILMMTFTSNFSSATRSGLTIYDANTKQVKFDAEENFFFSLYMRSFEVMDYQNDGDLDILVLSDKYGSGEVRVIDGGTYTQEAVSDYSSQDIEDFYCHTTTDIDGNGSLEIIAATSEKIHFISTNDLTIEWSSAPFSNTKRPKDIEVGNVDADSDNEIILSRDRIYKYDAPDYTESQSANEEYTSVKLFNWDTTTPQLEIIAGTEEGFIDILDGSSLDILSSYSVSSTDIDGIEIGDFNQDGVDEIMATSDSKVFFINNLGVVISSQTINKDIGLYNGIAIKDYDNDGIDNIILGSNYKITELDPICSKCLSFDPTLLAIDAKCGEDNGVILAYATDTVSTFEWEQNSFVDTLSNIGEGEYLINIASEYGCFSDTTLQINQSDFQVLTASTDLSCFGEDGAIYTNVTVGVAPYIFQWSNGSTSNNITSIPADIYYLTVTDGLDCIFLDTFNVEQSELITELNIIKPSCENVDNGAAIISSAQGLAPFIYAWNGVNSTEEDIYNLEEGAHEVIVTDALGCTSTHTFDIGLSILDIATNPLTISCNDNLAGSAEINVTVGISPYQYQWSNGLGNSNFVNNISSGFYYVTVTDDNDCIAFDSVFIDGSTLVLESNIENLDCFGDSNGTATVNITEGTPPFIYQWNTGNDSNSIDNLIAGNYFLLVTDSLGCEEVESITISSPPEINVGLMITPDESSTTVNEGAIFTTVSGGTPPFMFDWGDGSTTDSLINLGVGEYFLTITDANNCLLDTSIIVELFTSINDLEKIQIEVFPNPTSDFLFLKSKQSNAIQTIKLFSLDGKRLEVRQNKISDTETQLNLNYLPSGEYFLLLEIEDEFYYKKIIVQH